MRRINSLTGTVAPSSPCRSTPTSISFRSTSLVEVPSFAAIRAATAARPHRTVPRRTARRSACPALHAGSRHSYAVQRRPDGTLYPTAEAPQPIHSVQVVCRHRPGVVLPLRPLHRDVRSRREVLHHRCVRYGIPHGRADRCNFWRYGFDQQVPEVGRSSRTASTLVRV